MTRALTTPSAFLCFALALLVVPLRAEVNVAFEHGPMTGELGSYATIEVAEGDLFVPVSQMRSFNQMTGNIHDSKDVGAIVHEVETEEGSTAPDPSWIAFFNFDPSGYVKDDDKSELDAAEMLAAFKESDGPANEMRRKQNLPALETLGWSREPFYDPQTHNLTWGLRLRSGGNEIINHNIKLLGRRGVMSVILVCDPGAIGGATKEFAEVLKTFSYVEGQRYDEWQPGDKVAAVGLTGLVLGGGILAAAKGGLLAKLGKFAKVIVLGVIALFATVGKFFKRLFGGGGQSRVKSA